MDNTHDSLTSSIPPIDSTVHAAVVAGYAQRLACGEMLTDDDQQQCALAYKAFMDAEGFEPFDPLAAERDERTLHEMLATDKTVPAGRAILMAMAAFLAGLSSALLFFR